MTKCYLCNTYTKCDKHHIVPQARGGKNKPIVNLCPSCHSNIHNYANAIIKEESYSFGYKIDEEKAKKLAIILAKNYINEDHSNNIKFPIEMPLQLYNKIKIYKVDKNFKSIKDTILFLIVKSLKN